MMIHDRKIFNCKVSLSIAKSLVIVAKEIWRWFWSGSFRMVLSKKLP